MISLIHPSRGRPNKAHQAAWNWISKAGCEIDYILSLDADDTQCQFYENVSYNSITGKNRSAIDAINNAAKVAKGDILVVMSDDFDCPENWGQKIIEATKGKTDWILKTHDGIQEWIITLPIMDRTYYNRFGYIYHPDYLHMFCDTEMSCVADLTGRRLASNILFQHNNGDFDDEVRRRSNATWNQGERLFLERSKTNFDLQSDQIKGRITNSNYINWMRSKGIRL